MTDGTLLSCIGGTPADRAALREAIVRIMREKGGDGHVECLATWAHGKWHLEIARDYPSHWTPGGRPQEMPRDVRVELVQRLIAMGLPVRGAAA